MDKICLLLANYSDAGAVLYAGVNGRDICNFWVSREELERLSDNIRKWELNKEKQNENYGLE